MSTTNYPSASPQNQPPKKDSKNLIIGLLAVGILGTWGYFLWDKNKSDQKITQLQTQYVAVDSSKNELQKSFDAALTRLDSLTGYNNEIEGKLNDRTSEISKLKGQIGGILKKQRLTDAEKKKAYSGQGQPRNKRDHPARHCHPRAPRVAHIFHDGRLQHHYRRHLL